MTSRFSGNSEANVSEFLENLEYMFLALLVADDSIDISCMQKSYYKRLVLSVPES